VEDGEVGRIVRGVGEWEVEVAEYGHKQAEVVVLSPRYGLE